MAIGVSNQPSDAVNLLPMLEPIQFNNAQLPDAFIADSCYSSTANLKDREERGSWRTTSPPAGSTRPEAQAIKGPTNQRPGYPGAGWSGSSDLKPAKRSMPCACPWLDLYLGRSKAPEAWIVPIAKPGERERGMADEC